MNELTKKSKVTGVIFTGCEMFYALDKPFHMVDEAGNPIDGWAWNCVNSVPMNLDVLAFDEDATPVYDEPFVVTNVSNLILGLKDTPKEVEYLNPEYKFDEEGEPTEEEKKLMTEMFEEMPAKSGSIE